MLYIVVQTNEWPRLSGQIVTQQTIIDISNEGIDRQRKQDQNRRCQRDQDECTPTSSGTCSFPWPVWRTWSHIGL